MEYATQSCHRMRGVSEIALKGWRFQVKRFEPLTGRFTFVLPFSACQVYFPEDVALTNSQWESWRESICYRFVPEMHFL